MSEPMHPDDEAFVKYLENFGVLTLEVDGEKVYSPGILKIWNEKKSFPIDEMISELYKKAWSNNG